MAVVFGGLVAFFGVMTIWGGLSGNMAAMIAAVVDPGMLGDKNGNSLSAELGKNAKTGGIAGAIGSATSANPTTSGLGKLWTDIFG